MRKALFPALVLVLSLSAGLARAQTDPFDVDFYLLADQELEVIGWSEDENYYAVRLYSLRSDRHFMYEGGETLPRDCEGYVSHAGEKFNGSVSIHVFGTGGILENFPIQDLDTCTPLDKARERLHKAKEVLGEYGISLDRPGTKLARREDTFHVQDSLNAPYDLEYCLDLSEVPQGGFELHQGRHELYSVVGGVREKVLDRRIEELFSLGSGHAIKRGVVSVFVSPSKNRVLVYCYRRESSISYLYKKLWLFGILQWENGELKAHTE